MSILRHAAVLTIAAGLSIGAGAQATSTPSQQSTEPTSSGTQGMGNQRGAGLSPDNSSNGGAGTMQTSRKHKRHHHKKTMNDGRDTNSTAQPATPPQQ